jgi:hypothetical protein
MAIQVAGQNFESQWFSPENLFDRGDAITLFGDGATAIRRIDEKYLHYREMQIERKRQLIPANTS